MKLKPGSNESEALWSSIDEALRPYGRCASPSDLVPLVAELVEDATVRECLAAHKALERAMNRLDRRVARLLGSRAKTMGKTFAEGYPEIFSDRTSSEG